MARTVQERLDSCRRELYGGRGPGISDQDWARNTRMRGTVGGVPVAASREDLHLRTMRIRGDEETLEIEARWAATQFPSQRAEFTALAESAEQRRLGAGWVVGVAGLLLAAVWRLRRRTPATSSAGRRPR